MSGECRANILFSQKDESCLILPVLFLQCPIPGTAAQAPFHRDISSVSMSAPAIPSIEEFLRTQGTLTWYLDRMPMGIAIIRMIFDEENRPVDWQFAYCNEELARFEGLESESLQGIWFFRDLFPHGDRKWLEIYGRVATTGRPAHCRALSPKSGNYLEIQATSPCYGYCFCTLVNISEHFDSEQNIREYQNGIFSLMDRQLALLCFYDIDRRTIYNNLHTVASRQQSGRHPSTIRNVPDALVRMGVVSEEDARRMQDELFTPLEQGVAEAEMEILLNLGAADGLDDWQWYQVAMHRYVSVFPNVRRAVCSVRTIQEEVELRNRLRRKADADAVTGVFTRAAAEEVLDARLQKTEGPVCLFLFDLDNFKTINDTHGHVSGDNVLFFFAQLLKAQLRQHLVFRLGGDEFAAFAEGICPETASGLCRLIMEELSCQEQFSFPVECSCGVAWSDAACSYQDLYAFADRALYHSKRAGKNRWHVLRSGDRLEDGKQDPGQV